MAPEQPERIFAVGVNHKSGSAFLRDRLFIDEDMQLGVYARLAEKQVEQAVILSTCDRIEFQGVATDPQKVAAVIGDVFCGLAGAGIDILRTSIYEKFDDDAVRHIFAVAASLDSQVIGEPQVLGQVREGLRAANAAGMVGWELDQLFQSAYSTAKRVRTETTIGERAVSIASAATQIAVDIHGNLRDVGVLLIGLGEIAGLIVRHLRAAGVGRITLTASGRRTEREAKALGYHYLAMEDLTQGLVRADVTITAAGVGKYLVEKEAVDEALRGRRHRPMLFLDGGIPNDIEPSVHDLDDAFVYTLDDLERVAQQGRMQRELVAQEAWAIVDEEVARWKAGRAVLRVTPAVVALRAHFEDLRLTILTERPHADAAEATQLLINRLLHSPSAVLRELAEQGDTSPMMDVFVRRLFALDGDVMTGEKE